MVSLSALLPPEQGETWMSAYDALTSPRRGGVRFVDTDRAAWAQKLLHDPRTLDQIAADAFTQLLDLGQNVDPNRVFGGRQPAVKVIITERTLRQHTQGARTGNTAPDARTGQGVHEGPGFTPAGYGVIESNPAPVSWEAVEKRLCDAGLQSIRFDDSGRPLDVGREVRLFTERQRQALAVRDGGCRWPDCDHPPSFTEAHHLQEWFAQDGRTDLAWAVLLCRRHHLLLHNNHWLVLLNPNAAGESTAPNKRAAPSTSGQGTNSTDRYFLRPPAGIDPHQTLIPLPGTSTPMFDQQAHLGREDGGSR